MIGVALLLALEVAGSLDASNGARVYAREAIDRDGVAIDVENIPTLQLGLEWPATILSFEYAPRVFWSEVGGSEPSPTLLLHYGALRLSSRSERLTVGLAQTFAVGDQSFARLTFERELGPVAAPSPPGGVAPTPDLDLLPRATVVRVAAVESSASVRYDWSRRVRTELRPSLGISGGADAASRRVLPRQRTARIDAAVNVQASRRDALTTSAGIAFISISSGYDHRVVSVMETWSRSFSAQTGGSLGAGAAVQDTTGPTGASATDVQPTGVARVWHVLAARAARLELGAEVGAQPDVNALTGVLQHRLYASADATATAGATTVRLAVGATQSLPSDRPDAAQLITADLLLEHALLDWLMAEAGAQVVRQAVAGGGLLLAGDSSWLLFAGARAALPTLRF